jgi:predicted transcriptional regulator
MKNLKGLRRNAGLSQHALGSACGIARWRIAHSELGIVKLQASEISKIRKVLLAESKKKSARVLKELEPANEHS